MLRRRGGRVVAWGVLRFGMIEMRTEMMVAGRCCELFTTQAWP